MVPGIVPPVEDERIITYRRQHTKGKESDGNVGDLHVYFWERCVLASFRIFLNL